MAIACCTTAFFLLPSSGRSFQIYETWCFANTRREITVPIPKKSNAIGIAHTAYSIPLFICSTDKSETACTWYKGKSPIKRNNGFASVIGSKTGKRKIAIDATKATIWFLLIADISSVIPVTLRVQVNAKRIWYFSNVSQVILKGMNPLHSHWERIEYYNPALPFRKR